MSAVFLTVDSNDPQPIYRQVAEGIKALIARGTLGEGVMLPPVRQLAGDLGVNLNTIAVAYRELQQEGLITIRHGAGAVVASHRFREVSIDELRRPLRAALTDFVLSGLKKQEILNVVRQELDWLRQGETPR